VDKGKTAMFRLIGPSLEKSEVFGKMFFLSNHPSAGMCVRKKNKEIH
jgi:hypothetical protein